MESVVIYTLFGAFILILLNELVEAAFGVDLSVKLVGYILSKLLGLFGGKHDS